MDEQTPEERKSTEEALDSIRKGFKGPFESGAVDDFLRERREGSNPRMSPTEFLARLQGYAKDGFLPEIGWVDANSSAAKALLAHSDPEAFLAEIEKKRKGGGKRG